MATNGTSGTMERILRLMSEKKASDVYLSSHSPALIRINGQCVPINSQILPPDAPRNLLAEILPPNRIEELEELNELNMGWPLAGVGRFRISAMRQRGSIAVVIRFISMDIPAFATLSVHRILSFYPVEVRQTLLGDLSASLKAIVSQRLLRTTTGGRIPAVEIMLNTN